MNTQLHGTPDWPECWCFYNRADTNAKGELAGSTRPVVGARTTVTKGGALTYTCTSTCGSTFTRLPGFQNEEARAWVEAHRHHLPDEETRS